MYQLTKHNLIKRVSDGAIIPQDSGNSDFAAYEAWVASGHAAEPEPEPVFVPQVVSRFQARAALMQTGLLDEAEAAIAGADAVTKLAWAEALEFHRTSPTVNAMCAVLGLTEQQIDDLFVAAAQIEA